jgi:hypothetical protein
MRLRPHQEALCCLISGRLLLFLNRKTEKPRTPTALVATTDVDSAEHKQLPKRRSSIKPR